MSPGRLGRALAALISGVALAGMVVSLSLAGAEARAGEPASECPADFDLCVRGDDSASPGDKVQLQATQTLVFRDWEAEQTEDDFGGSSLAIETPLSEISIDPEPVPDFDQGVAWLYRLERELVTGRRENAQPIAGR